MVNLKRKLKFRSLLGIIFVILYFAPILIIDVDLPIIIFMGICFMEPSSFCDFLRSINSKLFSLLTYSLIPILIYFIGYFLGFLIEKIIKSIKTIFKGY